ncbi:hypothetical protein AB0C96_29540 [Streptomyces sp. NPDC048506]|uniref:hypothetical protein n=1 Tax=Streptomyces sp. NPDC048506 TaxID=3155028 RepID=UPI00342E117D
MDARNRRCQSGWYSGFSTVTSEILALQQSRYVSRAVLIGDRRPYPVALRTGEFTPASTVRRAAVAERCATQIEELYAAPATAW